jgi:hypothetical protein
MSDHITETTKEVVDVVAATTAFGAYFALLPEIAAILAIVWTAIRIGEWVHEKFQLIFRRDKDG